MGKLRDRARLEPDERLRVDQSLQLLQGSFRGAARDDFTPGMSTQQAEARILISQPEAARLLGGIDRTTVWRMVKHSNLTRVTIGSRSLITRESVEAYVRSQAKRG